MTRTLQPLAVAGLLASLSCGDRNTMALNDARPVPGRLTLVASSEQPIGGLVVQSSGAGLEAPQVLAGDAMLFTSAAEGTIRVALVGPQLDGRLLSVEVADVRRPRDYTVAGLQAANQANTLLERSEVTVRLVADQARSLTGKETLQEG